MGSNQDRSISRRGHRLMVSHVNNNLNYILKDINHYFKAAQWLYRATEGLRNDSGGLCPYLVARGVGWFCFAWPAGFSSVCDYSFVTWSFLSRLNDIHNLERLFFPINIIFWFFFANENKFELTSGSVMFLFTYNEHHWLATCKWVTK